MFSIIKITAICAIFFAARAFANSDGRGYQRHHHEEYRTGYDQNYGAGYARSVQYYPAQRPHYASTTNYSAHVQSMSIYDCRKMNGRPERDGRW